VDKSWSLDSLGGLVARPVIIGVGTASCGSPELRSLANGSCNIRESVLWCSIPHPQSDYQRSQHRSVARSVISVSVA